MEYQEEKCTPEMAQLYVLTEIHNRLAEISKFLEANLSVFAKLSDGDIEYIRDRLTQYMDIEKSKSPVINDGMVVVHAPFPDDFGTGINEYLTKKE